MAAGRGRECEHCYWKRTYEKRVSNNLEAYAHAQTRQLYLEFACWLEKHCGGHKASLTLRNYLSLFDFIEQGAVGVPDYSRLLRKFGAEGLRRIRTPMKWLTEAYGVVVDVEMREEHSELRRIGQLASTVTKGPALDAWDGYRTNLLERLRAGTSTIRSIRLALGAAAGLLNSAAAAAQDLPDQKTLQSFLRQKPGQRATIHGFVRYLNQYHSGQLDPDVGDRWLAKVKHRRLETQLLEMMKLRERGSDFERSWIATSLSFFHGVQRVSKRKLQYKQGVVGGIAGYVVDIAGAEYWIPSPESSTAFPGLAESN